LGGSIVAPDGADSRFLRDFVALVGEVLEREPERVFVFVVGGGGPARAWQKAYREICADETAGLEFDSDEADWIGVMATRLNAQLVRAAMAKWCRQEVVTDPTVAPPIEGRVLVAAGWKPGFSSDYDAVLLAERFGGKTVHAHGAGIRVICAAGRNLANLRKIFDGGDFVGTVIE